MDKGMDIRGFGLAVVAAALAATCLFAASAQGAAPGQSSKILFTEGWHVRTVDPGTGAVRKVVNGGGPYTPAAFANGRSFAYINGNANAIYIRNFNNPNIKDRGKRVFARPARDDRSALGLRALTVSRGAKRIVFSAVRGGYGRGKNVGSRVDIYSIRRDGSGLRRLTRNRAFDNDPALSPDGKRIAFARRLKGRARIFVMNADGSGQRQISRGPGYARSPSFSPDGRRIVYFGQLKRPGLDRWEETEIFTVSSRTGAHRVRVTHNRLQDFYPAFSPDGRRISMIRFYYTVVTVRTDGSHPQNVYRSSYGGGINWTNWAPGP